METYIDKVVQKVKEKAGVYNKELIKYYALLVLVKGEAITPKDIHDGWAMSMNYREKNEHCYGHDHFSLVPFKKLSKEVQEKDYRFVRALREIAREIKEEENGLQNY